MCDESPIQNDVVTAQVKKYTVQANKYLSVFDDFDTFEEAVARAAELGDYDHVTIRKNDELATEVW